MNSDTITPETIGPPRGLVPSACTPPYRRQIFLGRGVGIHFYHDRPARTCWPEHAHSRLELLLLSEESDGNFRWRRQDGSWEERSLDGPQLCVIPPDVVHGCDWKNTGDLIVLQIDPAVWPESRHATGGEVWTGEFSAVAGHDLVLWQLVVSLRKLYRQPRQADGPHVEMIGTVLATHLVKALVKVRAEPKPSESGLSPSQLERVLAYINAHLNEAPSIAVLAREACLSPFYFIRLFKQSTGLPPHRYVLKCRLLKAKELLSSGEFRVAEAAYETGFCDQSHLNRHFRKFFGFTPRALLKRRGDSQ